jgi:putative ABC transport system permease protein
LVDNIRFAVRQLRKNPGFAALAILTLALGIGANAAMFTVIDSVLLRPLAYRDPDRIVAISPGAATDTRVQSTSWLNYRDIREQATQFRAVAAYMDDFSIVHTEDSSLGVVSIKATAPLFDVLGVKPILGRAFADNDNQPGTPPVAILSYAFWKEHFAAGPHAIGKQIRVGDEPHTIIGVLPQGLRFPSDEPDAVSGIWVPVQPSSNQAFNRGANFLTVLGSLREGVTLQTAESEIESIQRQLARVDPEHSRDLRLHLIPYREVVTGEVKPVFLALGGALLLVLLIACANVANLQLARCLARSHELAVRTALGASRRALVAQMLTEGGVLSTIGALLGFALAQLMINGVHRLPPELLPRGDEIHLRATVFAMLLLAAVVTTLLSSIIPAVVAVRSDPHSVLQDASRGSSAGPRRSRLSGLMVAGEVALSVVLMIAGGLMFRTLYKMEHLYLGFDERNLVTFMALPGNAAGFFSPGTPPPTREENSETERAYKPMAERLRNLPGVLDVAFTNDAPFSGVDLHTSFEVAGKPESEQPKNTRALVRVISPGYSHVLGVPVIRGRSISEQDTAASPFVVTINEACARKYFAGQDPVGQRIQIAGKDNGIPQPYTIVGLLENTTQNKISESADPEIELPYAQVLVTSKFYPLLIQPETAYLVRTRGKIDVTSEVRSLFHQYAPDFALDGFTTIEAAHEKASLNHRIGLYLTSAFAGIAVVMVLAGLYGVLSQVVGQRRREIGIRMALGADRRWVLTMMLRRGLMLIGIGMGFGLLISIATVRSLRSFLFGVQPLDAMTYAGVVIALLLLGTLAAWVPAQRAASIEPSEALRTE